MGTDKKYKLTIVPILIRKYLQEKAIKKMLRVFASRLANVSRTQVSSLAVVKSRWMSGSTESDAEFDARWEAYFKRDDIDAWELGHGINTLYGHDMVPEPKIVSAALHACRRLNDYHMTVRIFEMIKQKAAGDKEIYNYILQQVKPTIDELGLSTPEELGLNA